VKRIRKQSKAVKIVILHFAKLANALKVPALKFSKKVTNSPCLVDIDRRFSSIVRCLLKRKMNLLNFKLNCKRS